MRNKKIKNMTVKERIIFFREDFGLTQTELAYAVGKPRQWIANFECRRPLSLNSAIILAKFFDVSLDLLILGKEK